MANIFTWETQDIDLKDCIKLKTNCQQLDTMIMQFNVYDYDIPVDLTNFNIEFRAVKPDGTLYSQVENITKVGNLLTITCDNQLTSINGKATCSIKIWDNTGNQKSSYFIVLNVTGIISDEDRVVSRTLIDTLEHLDNSIFTAMQINKNFDGDIDKANALDKAFQSSIATANDLETAFNNAIANANTNKVLLDNSNSNALDSKSKLETTISNANNTKNTVETTIDKANVIKTEVDASKISANIDKDALITTIANADAKLQEFQNYDTTEIVPKTNLMLNEMYCNKELLSINHGLNGYPVAKLTYTEFGGGIGGAGDFPAGADSDCNLMQNKVIYTDNNNMKIFVPLNYYIINPLINKINNHKYIVTFTNSTRSILIELIEGSVSEDIKLINSSITNINSSISDLNYQTATGTSNAIILTINGTLTNGYPLKFIANADNNGNATTINGKHCYKQNSTNAPIFKQGKAYDIWYNLNGDNFFLKANAVGNTISSHVLAGDGFSTDVDTDLIGTMPINNIPRTDLPINGYYVIPLGFHDGTELVTQDVSIKGEETYNPSTVVQTIYKNQYISENQIISATTGTANVSDVIVGKTFNSASGIGLIGTATIESLGGHRYAEGTVTSSSYNDRGTFTYYGTSTTTTNLWKVVVSGLSFTPKIIYLFGAGSASGNETIYSDVENKIKVVAFTNVQPDTDTYSGTFSLASQAYINSSGFLLPVYGDNASFTWVAFG